MGAYFYYINMKGGRGVSKMSMFFYKGGRRGSPGNTYVDIRPGYFPSKVKIF